MIENGTMMQYFEWDLPNDGKHWQRLKEDAAHLSDIGITAVWIPPCFKALGQEDVGYGIYDLYDLGEFDQKGTVRTKYGTKQELLEAIEELHRHNIQVYADVVLNHKAGADETERFKATPVDEENRHKKIGELQEIESWTKFNFPGRNGKYSTFEWHWEHFTGVSDDELTGNQGVYLIEGKDWAPDEHVSTEFGNFDYLMFADIDYNHPEVIHETKKWIKWFIQETGVDGIRLDAVKHIDSAFMKTLVDYVREEFGEDFFFVAEYWHQNYHMLSDYLSSQERTMALMDVRFHYAFHEISEKGTEFDLQRIADHTLYKDDEEQIVTFVENHDSQPGQSLESYVKPWFKVPSYAMILMSKTGYPCVFYSDYYGYHGEVEYAGCPEVLNTLLSARKTYAYGEQYDYFDYPTCIGFSRTGTEEKPGGCAVVLSTGEEGWKEMEINPNYAGETYVDILENRKEEIILDEKGKATFPVNKRSVSVWVPKNRYKNGES